MMGDPEEEEVAAFDEDEEDDEDDDEEKPRKKPAPPEMFNERAVGKMIADAVSAAVSAAFAAQKADLQKFAEASSGRSKSAVASAKKANVDALIERLSLEGRLPPAEREAIRQRLMRADSSRPAVKFSEKGKQPEMLTEFEAQVRELESRPTLFAERFKMPTAAAASADAEEARIEEHFDAFSERYQKLGQTREKFLGAFRAEKKMRPSVTVDEFLNK
jgi:hypothetical protein